MSDIKPGLDGTKSIIVVLSGKGGVGKSTVSAQIAIGLWKKGLRVGLLDVDFCGPSIPHILGLENKKIHSCPEGWLPVYIDSEKMFRVVSLGFLIENPDSAVVWRGPRKAGMVQELLNSVCWGDLDCLIIDTPPGTSDEHFSVIEQIQSHSINKNIGALIVSTSQRVSLSDVRRELEFCSKTGMKVIGLIENMSGYRCPNCAHCTNLFSFGGGEALAKEKEIPFIGRLSLDPQLMILCDKNSDFDSKSYVTAEMISILDNLLKIYPVCPVS